MKALMINYGTYDLMIGGWDYDTDIFERKLGIYVPRCGICIPENGYFFSLLCDVQYNPLNSQSAQLAMQITKTITISQNGKEHYERLCDGTKQTGSRLK